MSIGGGHCPLQLLCGAALVGKERVYRSQIRDVNQLKWRLIEEWERFHHVVIDEAVRQWRPHLRACVRLRAHGGHFEHRF